MMTTTDRIKKSLIQIQKRCSFWAYLSLYLKFQEIEAEKMDCPTMGVSPEGDVFYVKEFVKSLSDEELIGTIIHETCHLVFLSELRRGNRDHIGWNFASDLSINSILKENNFKLPKGVLIPDHQDNFQIGGKIIKDISKKTSEDIYNELPKIKMKEMTYVLGDGSGKELGKSFDVHLKGKDGKELSPKERKALEKKWMDKVAEAVNVAKMKGDIPKGMGRLIGKLTESKINWRVLLQRYIQNSIPHDFSYQTPHKKSIAIGVYMPNVVREQIEVTILIDCSGSIGEAEIVEFISEVLGIARAYQGRISMRILTHETKINEDYEIANGNIEKIKSMKLTGGGGTSHIQPFNFIRDNIRNCKCVISLTDGFSDIDQINFDEFPFDKLFVISKGGSDDQLKNKRCQVIRLKK